MKKFLCLSLAMLMMLLTLASCSFENDDETEVTDDTSEQTEELPFGLLQIIKDGQSDVNIIYPNRDGKTSAIADKLAKAIHDKFGIFLETEPDDRVEYDKNTVEILVGNTNRPESDSNAQTLTRSSDYVCKLVGKKLVLIGSNVSATTKAVDYFIYEYVVTNPDSNNLIYSNEDDFFYFNNHAISISKCAGTDLKDFTIVYPKGSTTGEYYTALNLRRHLYKNMGIDVPVVDDSTAAKGKEILIGKTNRNKTPIVANGEFSVSVQDGNLCIAANDFFGFLDADNYLTKTLFTKLTDPELLDNTFVHTADASTMPKKAGSYRVIYNNIWGLPNVGYLNRDEYAAAFFLAYKPDVIALNEFWDGFRNEKVLAETLKANGYLEVIAPAKTIVHGNTGNPNNNVLPIFYNPKTVKLVDSAYYHYQWYTSDVTVEKINNGTARTETADDSKGVTIAVFEGLNANGTGNGEQFIVCNTHFTSNYFADAHGNEIHGYYSRMLNIETTWGIVQEFSKKYSGASTLLGCDFNCNISSNEVKKLQGYGFKSCNDLADSTNNVQSHHGAPILDKELGYFTPAEYDPSGTYKNSIDHIFAYGTTLDAKVFNTYTNDYTATYSDHSPLLLDFNVVK